MAAYTVGFMTHVTCRLTAKNRDQLRNTTLGNRVWATFTFLFVVVGWLGSRVVSVLDSGAEGPGFKSQSRRCRITIIGKLVVY